MLLFETYSKDFRPLYISFLVHRFFNFLRSMGSRKASSRESDRMRSRTGEVGSERIRYGNVSDTLTKVLREETRLPH